MTRVNAPLLALMLCLPLGAHAAAPKAEGVNAEIKREMAGARAEIRTEMDKARAELDRGNLSLRDSVKIGKGAQGKASDNALPEAHITPTGELVIDGKAVTTTAQQRQQLLSYRQQVLDLAKAGIEGGEKAALAALQVTDVSLFSLIVGGLTGSLERRVETLVKQNLQPMVMQICQRLPEIRASQQQLAVSVPEFQPYANMEQDDVEECENEVTRSLAVR
jgi:hypothetical protein